MRVAVEYNTFDDVYKNSWSGALDTLNDIQRAEKEADFMWLLEEMFEDRTPTETEVNDFIWFDREYIYEQCGLDENGEIEDDTPDYSESWERIDEAEDFEEFCDDCDTCILNEICGTYTVSDCERIFKEYRIQILSKEELERMVEGR